MSTEPETAHFEQTPGRPPLMSPSMTQQSRHKLLSRAASNWLQRAGLPTQNIGLLGASLPAAETATVLRAAELHGVLPNVLKMILQSGCKNSAQREIKAARELVLNQTAFELALKHHGSRVLEMLTRNGLEAIVVKGPTFAKRLYPEAGLRSFTDIDILISKESRTEARALLPALGFTLQTKEYRGEHDYFEDAWCLSSDDRIGIEIHCDLSHNPKLRRSASVKLADVMDAGNGNPEDATALLLVAAAHGALSHQFDRLQHLVDVALAAKGAAGNVCVPRLIAVSKRCGLKRAIYVALIIAGRMFDEAQCFELASQFEPNVADTAISYLITPRTVLTARSGLRSRTSWRRKAFRQTLRLL